MKKQARFLGIDISTTAISAGVSDGKKEEDFVTIPVKGATTWNGQPAFHSSCLPDLIHEALKRLQDQGWNFSQPGNVCISVRQHDMVVLGPDNCVLLPILTWKANAATEEVKRLQEMGAESVVGKIEPRFILPKLMWVLERMPELADCITHVMTTGDYIGLELTGFPWASTSDFLSNALLIQKTKELAIAVIHKAGLKPEWFPIVIQSGKSIGAIISRKENGPWSATSKILKGWNLIAGLADNHAGAVGVGLKDFTTMVLSFGSSGTVVRKARRGAILAGKAAQFEYFTDTLLLRMLEDCAIWWGRFTDHFNVNGFPLAILDELAMKANLSSLCFVGQQKIGNSWEEIYPGNWSEMPLSAKVASTQASIAVYMLRLVQSMLSEIRDSDTPAITNFVITGGMARSEFIRQVLLTGLEKMVPNCSVQVSDRKGPLTNKATTVGAIFTAMAANSEYGDIAAVIQKNCILKDVRQSEEFKLHAAKQKMLEEFLAANI